MKITNNKFNISLAIGIFFIIAAWLLLAPEFSELKKVEGAITSVEPKKMGLVLL